MLADVGAECTSRQHASIWITVKYTSDVLLRRLSSVRTRFHRACASAIFDCNNLIFTDSDPFNSLAKG